MILQIDEISTNASPAANIVNTDARVVLSFDAAPACLDGAGLLVELVLAVLVVDEVLAPVADEGTLDVFVCESSTSVA